MLLPLAENDQNDYGVMSWTRSCHGLRRESHPGRSLWLEAKTSTNARDSGRHCSDRLEIRGRFEPL
jgi:hypothetical protein